MSGIKTVRVRVVGLIFLLPSNTVSTAIEPLTSAVEARAATSPPPLPRLNIAKGSPLNSVLDRCCFPCPCAAGTSNASPVSTRTVVSASLPHPGRSCQPSRRSPAQLPDVEKLDFRINHIIDRALDVRLRADRANGKGTCLGAQFQLPRQSNPSRIACTTLPVLDRCDW
jgi:hypothetical protein